MNEEILDVIKASQGSEYFPVSLSLVLSALLKLLFISSVPQSQHNLRKTVASEAFKLIIVSSDKDMKIDLKRSHLLALKLKMQLKPHGVDLNADMFLEMLNHDNSMGHTLKFFSDMLYPQVALRREEGKIWREGLEDALDNTRHYPSFDDAILNLRESENGNENKTLELVEKLSMLSVGEKYSGNSVEVARGKQMCILPASAVPSERIVRTTKVISEASKYCLAAMERAES